MIPSMFVPKSYMSSSFLAGGRAGRRGGEGRGEGETTKKRKREAKEHT